MLQSKFHLTHIHPKLKPIIPQSYNYERSFLPHTQDFSFSILKSLLEVSHLICQIHLAYSSLISTLLYDFFHLLILYYSSLFQICFYNTSSSPISHIFCSFFSIFTNLSSPLFFCFVIMFYDIVLCLLFHFCLI